MTRNKPDYLAPPLNYLGNKKRYTSLINNILPSKWDGKRYVEPFVGSGAIFLNLSRRPEEAILGDMDIDAINVLRAIQKSRSIDKIFNVVSSFYANNSIETFNNLRHGTYVATRSDSDRAGMYIYLTRNAYPATAHRCVKDPTNMRGCFHPCMFHPEKVRDELNETRRLLRKTNIEWTTESYEHTLAKCRPGDFVVLDPPYMSDNKGAYYYYGNTKIDWDFFMKEARRLDRLGCFVMIFNFDKPELRNGLGKRFHVIQNNIHSSLLRNSDVTFINYKLPTGKPESLGDTLTPI